MLQAPALLRDTTPSPAARSRLAASLAMFPWLVISLGIASRLDQYLLNRSLWLDEAMVAVNFRHRGFLELIRPPLDYSPGPISPPGFLLVTKLLITCFGTSEWVLRLFPFLAGVASLFLFRRLAQSVVPARAVPVALLFFSFSPVLVYYASEFKPYSSDVAITLAVLCLTVGLTKRPPTNRECLFLAVGGAVAVWFSHPVAFVLFVAATSLAIHHGRNRQWPATLGIGLASVAWFFSFLAMYSLTVGNVKATPVGRYFIHFWTQGGAFMPSPLSTATLTWLFESSLRMLDDPASLRPTPLTGCVFVVGWIAMLARKRRLALLLTLPIALAMAASFFEVYPFSGRQLLFLVPAVYLVSAEGIARIHVTRSTRFPGPSVTLFIRILVVAVLLVSGFGYERRWGEELRPVLEYVQRNKRETDTIYLYHWSEPAFRYYDRDYGFDYDDCRLVSPIPKNEYLKDVDYFRQKTGARPVGVDGTRCILGVSEVFSQARIDLDQLRSGSRVWLIFSHAGRHTDDFLAYLDRRGARLAEFSRPAAFAYLYEL